MKFFSKKNILIFAALTFAGVAFAFFIEIRLSASSKALEDSFPERQKVANYVGGVVPHHLLAESIIKKFFDEISKESYPEKIVLFGPDHFNAAAVYGDKLIAADNWDNNLEDSAIDNGLLRALMRANDIALGNYAVKNDHGLMNILPFIKKYFPNAEIVPFLIPAAFSLDKAENIAESLNEVLPENSLVLSSVDWSHYLPKNVADFHDKKSIRVFLNLEEENFSNIEVDCPQCLYVVRQFAKLRNADNYVKIDHKNSQDFSSDDGLDSTTSYFSAIFSKQANDTLPDEHTKTFLFLGDIMLDRGVERLMDKNGLLYPIKNMRNFLTGTDAVVGNLEGPVVLEPEDTPDDSMRFNFGLKALDLLRYARINLVSLANNHTSDGGKDGLSQTRRLLGERDIKYFGDPVGCDKENVFRSDGIVFVGLNKTFPFNCSQARIEELIKKVAGGSASDFLVVFIHWGEEYRSASNAEQKELAHLMIDSGADLVMGAHPHVVEEIELYNGKFIFYSLGNFIFDQYFSKETQEGLAVGLELEGDKALFHLFPFGSRKSQPYLMGSEERIRFLENLSSKSPTIPKSQILNGAISAF